VQHALDTYHLLSEKGVGAATFRLGKLVEYSASGSKGMGEAVRLYRAAIEQGYDLANLQMARLYAAGRGVPQDLARARRIFERFAIAGSLKAAHELGLLYTTHRQQLAADWLDKAIAWHGRAAKGGYLDAKFALAELLMREPGQDRVYAATLLKQAALTGHGRAMLRYGSRLFHGADGEAQQVEGLAFVLAAARGDTSGALKDALALMDLIDRPEDILQANWRSMQLRSAVDQLSSDLLAE
jgi:TPR repeat protein